MPHLGRFESFTTSAPAPFGVTAGASPYTFTAPRDGVLVVAGGAVSLVQYGRGATLTALGLVGGLVPLKANDTVRITYVVAPTLTFIPW